MKIIGIIAEYNPFHNGHLYQIEKVKEIYPESIIIVAMSGNFLQRGEPAIVDKWVRARQALLNGVDVVVEIPIAGCVQPAIGISTTTSTPFNSACLALTHLSTIAGSPLCRKLPLIATIMIDSG